jgi:hypothetical protein
VFCDKRPQKVNADHLIIAAEYIVEAFCGKNVSDAPRESEISSASTEISAKMFSYLFGRAID